MLQIKGGPSDSCQNEKRENDARRHRWCLGSRTDLRAMAQYKDLYETLSLI